MRNTIADLLVRNHLESYATDGICTLCEAICLAVSEKNKVMNLTAVKEPARMALLHITDSLSAAPYLPQNARVLDVGSGGGFPALPLAAARPDLRIVALDSTAKKMEFVKQTAESLGLRNLSTLSARAEEASHNDSLRGSFDVVISRAVASLPILCELCLPFVKKGGLFVAMKGEKAEEERALAGNAAKTLGGGDWQSIPLSLSDGVESFSRFLLICEKVGACEKKYPRSFAAMSKNPLK